MRQDLVRRWSPQIFGRVVPRPPTAAAAIVMAVGVFGAAALQRIPDAGSALTKPLAAVVAVLWLAIISLLLGRAASDGLAIHTAPVIGSFGIGTWVAASAVVARMAMLAAPAELWLAKGALVVSAGLWVWFIARALRNLVRLFVRREMRPTGLILLSTVATEAVSLMTLRLAGGAPALRNIALGLMALGAACYGLGVFLILRRYAQDPDWRLAGDWDDSNCILHGALSITGLTATVSGFFDAAAIGSLWICTGLAFLAIESIELARALARLRHLGWRQGLFVYDVSQWARNFTFGMFYAFTLAFAERFPLEGRQPLLDAVRRQVLDFGQYVVLFFLLAELLLMLLALGRWLHARGAGDPQRV